MNVPVAEISWEIVDVTDLDSDLAANISTVDDNGWCGFFCSSADIKN